MTVTEPFDVQKVKADFPLLQREVKDRGVASIVVTHDQRVVEYGDRTIHIQDGALEA